jgi:CubicO group peptidase (beta-lactamase class C family)/tetratricopeptide (TPR) repeat protein
MAQLGAAYPSDLEAKVFYALALILAQPPDDVDLVETKKAVQVLTPLLQEYPDHPGIAHYLIHACDTPQLAQQGLEAARRYAQIAPASPHALHMPGHIFARLGLWQEDIRSNLASKAAAENAHAGAENRLHAMEFLEYAYLQIGRDEDARAIIAEAKTIPQSEVDPRYGNYYAIVQVRFPTMFAIETHDWIVAAHSEPLIGDEGSGRSLTLLAHAIAAGHLRDHVLAKATLQATQVLRKEQMKGRPLPRSGTAEATFMDEIHAWTDFANGNLNGAVRLLRPIADRQDKVGKGELDLPVREMMAEMLLIDGKTDESLREYQASLKSDPNRFNGLLGAAKAAEQLGQRDLAVGYYRTLLTHSAGANGEAMAELRHAQATAAQSAVFATDSARMDQVIRAYVENNQFMGAVLVARGDEVLLSKGYGFANLEWKMPNTPETKFRLGSITKQFTAASVLLLEEREKLQIDDPIGKYLLDMPKSWSKITIYHLLTHTSGIPNFTALADYEGSKAAAISPEQRIARLRDQPLDFDPGTRWAYSNSGYVVLGELIQKVSGVPYAQFVRDNIFTPIGMKDSGYDSNSAVIERRASGYRMGAAGALLNAEYIDMTVPYAAGGLYSTTPDLLKWETALFGGKVLTEASLAKMITPFMSNYAFGLGVEQRGEHKRIAHNGGIDGFRTEMHYWPDQKITVVVLANEETGAPADIVAKLDDLAQGRAVSLPSERKEISLPRNLLRQYVGTYQASDGLRMMVTQEGSQLISQISGQAKAPIYPESRNRFFWKVVDAEAEFARDTHGKVKSVVIHQGGNDVQGTRISDSVATPKAIVADTLNAYPGTYELKPGFDLVITREGNHLAAQATRQPKLCTQADID